MKTILALLMLATAARAQYVSISGGGQPTYGSSAVTTPTFSPIAGAYSSTQTVTISTSTALAVICYTTDGSTPTEVANLCSGGTTQTYTTPISVSTTQTVKALGTKAGLTDSAIAPATYTIYASYASNYCASSGTLGSSCTITGVTAGQTILVQCSAYLGSSNFTSATDSNGSVTGTAVLGPNSALSSGTNAYYDYVAVFKNTASGSHIITCNGATSPTYEAVIAAVVNGASTTSPIDTSSTTLGGYNCVGPITTSSSNELVVSFANAPQNGIKGNPIGNTADTVTRLYSTTNLAAAYYANVATSGTAYTLTWNAYNSNSNGFRCDMVTLH